MVLLEKKALRRELRRRRDALDGRDARSTAICVRILGLPLFTAARMIHCYLPILSEVDTLPLIHAALAADKLVAVPVVHNHGELVHARLDSLGEHNLLTGALGTLQPRHLHLVEPGAWDVTIVPLLGFDRRGYRLGYGKAYYDRLLAATGAPSIGVAFAIQEVPALPVEPHDIPLSCIVTEDELIWTEGS